MKKKNYDHSVRGRQMGSHGQSNFAITPFGRIVIVVFIVWLIYFIVRRFV